MACGRCLALLECYQRCVKLYGEAVLKMSGTSGNEFELGVENARELLSKCRCASDALNTHSRQCHDFELEPTASKAVGC
jgi:hypothetical protein